VQYSLILADAGGVFTGGIGATNSGSESWRGTLIDTARLPLGDTALWRSSRNSRQSSRPGPLGPGRDLSRPVLDRVRIVTVGPPLREDTVHFVGAFLDDWAELVAVDPFGDCGVAVADEA
jgi:hypothetical protein